MKNLTKPLLLILIFLIVIPLSCDDKKLEFENTHYKKTASEENYGFNHEKLGKFVYHHVKYYLATIDPYEFLDKEVREDFRRRFEEKVKMFEEQNWEYEDALDHLNTENVYTHNQVQILKRQHQELRDFLINKQPDLNEMWDWMLKKDKEVKGSNSLTLQEKSQILNINAISRYLLKYKYETKEATNLSNARVADACGFWEKAFCWLGPVQSLAGLAGAIVGGSGPIGVISAAIGATVGVYNAVNNCNCNKNFCGPFEGLSFDYKCYSPGDPLLFTGWGYGNITPDSYTFTFSRNENLTDEFWGNFTSQPYIWLPGGKIEQYNVDELAVKGEVICSGTPKVSYHGWFTINDLGKPIGIIDGEGNIASSDADYYYSFYYDITGPVLQAPNVSFQWEVIPSGYPGYSATGDILGSGTSSTVGVDWDGTPGIATLKCTATSNCGTKVHYFSIHIYDDSSGGYY